MKISIITLFPRMVECFFQESIIKRAQEKGFVEISYVNFRDFSTDKYKTVDDRPYGGGAGMVLRSDIVIPAVASVLDSISSGGFAEAVNAGEFHRKKNILNNQAPLSIAVTSPKGKPFTHTTAQKFSKLQHLIIIAGHYEAIDERVHEVVDEEISMGDFVMTGGEIAAAAIVDATVRLLPGVLKKEEAALDESYMRVSLDVLRTIVGSHEILNKLQARGIEEVVLLEYPHYTRPEQYFGIRVPAILLSGDHRKIEAWQLKKAFEETLVRRPDLLRGI